MLWILSAKAEQCYETVPEEGQTDDFPQVLFFCSEEM